MKLDGIKSLLPVHFSAPYNDLKSQQIRLSFGLQRSGQHLIIEWLCRGYEEVIHLNHCRFHANGLFSVLSPVTGRRIIYANGRIDDSGIQGRANFMTSLPEKNFERLFYSLEDVNIDDSKVRKLIAGKSVFIIIILRDPCNWLASSIRHGITKEELKGKIRTLKKYLQQALSIHDYVNQPYVAINYNKFITDREYRSKVAEEVGLCSLDAAEVAMTNVPDFGGGSSFSGRESDVGNLKREVFQRWRKYIDHPLFIELVSDSYLMDLAVDFFDEVPGLAELRDQLNL